MSESKLQRLVSQVNQIALNMRANGSEEMVADQVAQHLEKFWAPPMKDLITEQSACLLYTSPSPRDRTRSRMPSSA